MQYGKGAVAGHPATDRICFGQNEQCVDGMSFLSVISSRDVESLQGSGLVGLSPAPAKELDIKSPMTNGVPGFIAQLKDSTAYGKEFEKMFSLYLSNKENVPGKITFGGYDVAKYAKKGLTDKDVFWVDQSRNE